LSLIIKNISILLGNDLKFINQGRIVIGKNGLIKYAGTNNNNYDISQRDLIFDGEGLLACPGFINAHTHIGDSIGKDIGIDLDLELDQRIHPQNGLKKRILKNSERSHLKIFMRASALGMMKRGIVAFADFREGEIEGIKLLDEALLDLSIKCVRLGRPEYYFNSDQLQNQQMQPHDSRITSRGARKEHTLSADFSKRAASVLELCDGFGLSGANENSDESLNTFRKLVQAARKSKRNVILAIHAAESKKAIDFSNSTMHRTEVQRILLNLKPDFIVHMTNASDDEISKVTKQGIGIVVCPSSNALLRTGFPNVSKMLRLGCCVGIGTDNTMTNSPDMFREMEFLWKMSRLMGNEFLSARDILKMGTVNGGKILRINSGSIAPNMCADIIFFMKDHIDLAPMHDPYAAIVHRADMNSISNIMIDGKLIDGDDI
jgi:cytosine/adenosine deaminase-related metal-dependent hydrolase